jgi:hypothetical protein
MGQRSVVGFVGRVRVVDGLDFAGSTRALSVVTFHVKEFLDGNNVTMGKKVVGMKREVRLGDTIEGVHTYSELNTFCFESVKICIDAFWPFWSWYDTEAKGTRNEGANFRRQIVYLNDDWCCRRSTTSSLV